MQLDLGRNKIATLPSDFAHPTLSTLVLDDNLLDGLPECVLSLSQISELRLTGNTISLLPADIGFSCNHLRVLMADRNQLSEVRHFSVVVVSSDSSISF